MERCVVVCPRHSFIKTWMRAYFASGNRTPLVILTGPEGDWNSADMKYCQAAARYSGGRVIDCRDLWKKAEELKSRAVLHRQGWYTKKLLLHRIASELKPDVWAWIDDDVEVRGNLDECFEYAENAPGFILSHFYIPDENDNRHPKGFYRAIARERKICWNSLVFFHGEANRYLTEALAREYDVEDDECIFGYLYETNADWHEGFLDFSSKGWQSCVLAASALGAIPSGCKAVHYASYRNHKEVKRLFAAKRKCLELAPFESGPRTLKSRFAFAIAAQGSVYKKFHDALVDSLRRYAPSVDIIDINPCSSTSCLGTDLRGVDIYMARLAIPLLEEFRHYDKVVYLDVDVDCMRPDIEKIFNADTSMDGIAMCRDPLEAHNVKRLEDAGLSLNRNIYFNSGCILFDFEKLNREDYRRKLQNAIEKWSTTSIGLMDQDVLNLLDCEIEELDIKYNLPRREASDCADPFIIHYMGAQGLLEDILRRRGLARDKNQICVVDDTAVDAVFVIGTGSKNDNLELRYALRNLEKNCPFVRDVYICGECPDWVDKSVVKHLPWPDRFRHAKDANIIDKLRHACEQPGIAKRILFCSDDQFQTHECTWDDFSPRYLRRYWSGDDWYAEKNRVWHTRLQKTLERDVARRQRAGLDANRVYYYQPHMWMQIDRDKFVEYAKWCGYETRDDTIIASGYFNYAEADGKPNFDHAIVRSGARKCPDVTHIGYFDGVFSAAISILEGMFPFVCEFESEDCPRRRMTTKSSRAVPDEAPTQSDEAEDFVWEREKCATAAERDSMLLTLSKVRRSSAADEFIPDISIAREMQLFCVKGWRKLFDDIKRRVDAAIENESSCMSMSNEAKVIFEDYKRNPVLKRIAQKDKVDETVVSFEGTEIRFGTPPSPEDVCGSMSREISLVI